jgi:hypothetical protein
VQHRDLVSEAGAQARDDLVGERDLGDEHERLAPLAQRARDGAEVDLGLAASGDAVEQEALGAALGHRLLDGAEGLGLLRRELHHGRLVEPRRRLEWSEPPRDLDVAPPGELDRRARRARNAALELCGGQRTVRERAQHRLLTGRAGQRRERGLGVEALRSGGHLLRARPHACACERFPAGHQTVRLEGRQQLAGVRQLAPQGGGRPGRAGQLAEQRQRGGRKRPGLERGGAPGREDEGLDRARARARRERRRERQPHGTQDPIGFLA